MPTPEQHEKAGEGLLHQLTDDEFFDDLHRNPAQVLDADGNEVDTTSDIVDLRAQKEAGLL